MTTVDVTTYRPALSRGSRWRRIVAVARRHVYTLKRSPHRLFDLTLWPLVDMLLFGSLAVFFARQSGTGELAAGAPGYLLSGIVLWHVLYQAQIAVSTGFLEETWSRNVLALMAAPLREWEYVAGVALFGMAKLIVGVAVAALTAFGFYAFNIGTLGFGLVPVFALLVLSGWAVALVVVGLVLRFGTGAEAFAWGILFVLMPLSGAFYPVDALPGVLQPISALLPTTHAFTVARGLIDGNGIDWHAMWVAAVTTVGLMAVSVVYVTRMLKLFRRRGYITRFV